MKIKNSITEGVKVSVVTEFKPEFSNISAARFVHVYHITIENHNAFPVRLMHRDWFIFDSLNETIHVSGEGVIGEQPNIQAGEVFQYASSCELFSEIGGMHGFYSFINQQTGKYFRVEIPNFILGFPGKWN